MSHKKTVTLEIANQQKDSNFSISNFTRYKSQTLANHAKYC